MKENHIAMTILIAVSVTAALGLVLLYNAEQTATVVYYNQPNVYGGATRQSGTPYQRALEQQFSRQLYGQYEQYDPYTIYVTATSDAHIATYGKGLDKIPSWMSETGACSFYLEKDVEHPGKPHKFHQGIIAQNPQDAQNLIDTGWKCQIAYNSITGKPIVSGTGIPASCCSAPSGSRLPGSI